MVERPILFSGPMVRALLAGTKTQTRRVFKTRNGGVWPHPNDLPGMQQVLRTCPYGRPGDRLWVRETWMNLQGTGIERVSGSNEDYAYGADTPKGSYGDDQRKCFGLKWRPSIHMPRAASRITLEISDRRVERLQDISEADAVAEGIFRKVRGTPIGDMVETATGGQLIYADPSQAREEYRRLWEQINGPGSWAKNPWVWVLQFKRLHEPRP